MSNQLINETSPYLRQHAENPVDWFPWSEPALQKARQEDKPIFLSIGYAACHWCHVMAHESFEDPHTAAFLNQNFVSIKVDREEHPELDNIYMAAVVAMTGQGGWPMSVFLTPDLKPFYSGTYFPPTPRHGLPAFLQVLQGVQNAWQSNREQIFSSADQVRDYVKQSNEWPDSGTIALQPGVLQKCVDVSANNYDWQNGGWGRAPKFPQPMTIDFLLGQAIQGNKTALEIALHALDSMSQGGMYDLIGGGFHRYSTDAHWTVPHFEKMLYDNALLAQAYLHAFLISGKQHYRQVCVDSLDFLLREMTNPQGGFYSSLDADVEGQEGAFYLWSFEEIQNSLGEALSSRFAETFVSDDTAEYEGKLVLRSLNNPGALPIPEDTAIRAKLMAARSQRVRPPADQKVVVSWNSLAMRSLAEAGRYLNRPDYLQAAQRNADFLLTNLYSSGYLMRTWRDGHAHIGAFLEDYAGLAVGLLSLYQADLNLRWFSAARSLINTIFKEFSNPAGGFFDTSTDREDLLVKPVNREDNATPSGNSLAALGLLWMDALDENQPYRDLAENALGTIQEKALSYPPAYAFWLQALDYTIRPIQQVALIWPQDTRPDLDTWRKVIDRSFNPGRILAGTSLPINPDAPGLLKARPAIDNRLTAYLCQDFVCRQPVNEPEALANQLS